MGDQVDTYELLTNKSQVTEDEEFHLTLKKNGTTVPVNTYTIVPPAGFDSEPSGMMEYKIFKVNGASVGNHLFEYKIDDTTVASVTIEVTT